MTARLFVTAGILLYACAVPFLEINATHLFNPQWVSHARLHEAWQLATNTSIGALSLWLAWCRNEIRVPAILTLVVAGGFLVAYVLRGAYGGSMRHTDGSELTVLGVNLGVIGFGVAVALAAMALALERRRGDASPRRIEG